MDEKQAGCGAMLLRLLIVYAATMLRANRLRLLLLRCKCCAGAGCKTVNRNKSSLATNQVRTRTPLLSFVASHTAQHIMLIAGRASNACVQLPHHRYVDRPIAPRPPRRPRAILQMAATGMQRHARAARHWRPEAAFSRAHGTEHRHLSYTTVTAADKLGSRGDCSRVSRRPQRLLRRRSWRWLRCPQERVQGQSAQGTSLQVNIGNEPPG